MGREIEKYGVVFEEISTHVDQRGFLSELFRIDNKDGHKPECGYISFTLPGVARGGHLHARQIDKFYFLDGTFELHLWAKKEDGEYLHYVENVGVFNQVMVLVPAGVIHGYKNVSNEPAFVLNFPDKLYAGWDRKEPVDEVRYDDILDSSFRIPPDEV